MEREQNAEKPSLMPFNAKDIAGIKSSILSKNPLYRVIFTWRFCSKVIIVNNEKRRLLCRINEEFTDQLYANSWNKCEICGSWKCYTTMGSMHRLKRAKSAVENTPVFHLIWSRIRWQTKSIWTLLDVAALNTFNLGSDFKKLPIGGFWIVSSTYFLFGISMKNQTGFWSKIGATADQNWPAVGGFSPQTPQQDGGQ